MLLCIIGIFWLISYLPLKTFYLFRVDFLSLYIHRRSFTLHWSLLRRIMLHALPFFSKISHCDHSVWILMWSDRNNNDMFKRISRKNLLDVNLVVQAVLPRAELLNDWPERTKRKCEVATSGDFKVSRAAEFNFSRCAAQEDFKKRRTCSTKEQTENASSNWLRGYQLKFYLFLGKFYLINDLEVKPESTTMMDRKSLNCSWTVHLGFVHFFPFHLWHLLRK